MKILLLTSLYPLNNKIANTTPVVHYFVKEWKKQGHEIIVIHNKNKYILPVYYIPNPIKLKIESSFNVRFPSIEERFENEYEMEGIKVFRIPVSKYIPFGLTPDKYIVNQAKKIHDYVSIKNSFVPDIIVGHWEYPQIPLISLLKRDYFVRSKTAIVFHEISYIVKYKKIEQELINFDYFGFRSNNLLNRFEKTYRIMDNQACFMCLSGLPDTIIKRTNFEKKVKYPIKRFLFVGLMIKRKYPDALYRALAKSSFRSSFELTYVGDGGLLHSIKKEVKNIGIDNQVKFNKRLIRKEVFEIMKYADCFIMISRDEAFGLVYLEALLMGCIVIASKDEGIDGIIIHGLNGFLIESGNENQLIEILDKIHTLSYEEISAISINASQTARKYSNSKVAKDYLDTFIN